MPATSVTKVTVPDTSRDDVSRPPSYRSDGKGTGPADVARFMEQPVPEEPRVPPAGQ